MLDISVIFKPHYDSIMRSCIEFSWLAFSICIYIPRGGRWNLISFASKCSNTSGLNDSWYKISETNKET